MNFDQLKRRDFVALLGGAAATWPLTGRAQQVERMRRIGVFMNTTPDDSEAWRYVAAFLQALGQLGWSEGRNLLVEMRWGAADIGRARKYAAELAALAPDVILAGVGLTVPLLIEATRTVPIVFAQHTDPVGAGSVASLAQPGGNATGFTQFEYTLSGKWPQILKEIAPATTRAAILRDYPTPAGIGQWAVMQAVAPSVGMELSPIGVRDAGEIERAIAAFARSANGGLIVAASSWVTKHRQLIIESAARHRLPGVYPYRHFVTGGGLISYGPDLTVLYRQAANYVDRILKGEKPADLPVQATTKYDLVINLKTAKALGLTVPPTLLARADEVIE